eukprot:TRINITY_DN9028_c1_g1_i1.p1 TRINITY_DN9028_c1_g1~~TRINITY_DN9028_c1_g1_i1.p1  ORF type:complete len:210 (+),score=-21.36 TRINITY_DN9028_c1_g1_i1:53-631(+)
MNSTAKSYLLKLLKSIVHLCIILSSHTTNNLAQFFKFLITYNQRFIFEHRKQPTNQLLVTIITDYYCYNQLAHISYTYFQASQVLGIQLCLCFFFFFFFSPTEFLFQFYMNSTAKSYLLKLLKSIVHLCIILSSHTTNNLAQFFKFLITYNQRFIFEHRKQPTNQLLVTIIMDYYYYYYYYYEIFRTAEYFL